MTDIGLSVVAEVGQAGDILLVPFVLGIALLVGLALFALDALVGRLRDAVRRR